MCVRLCVTRVSDDGGRFYASTWAASNDYDYDYGF